MHEQEPGKRIVSKGEYAKVQLRKLWGGLCIALAFCCLGLLFWRSPHNSLHKDTSMRFVFDLITLTMMAVGTYSIGKSYLQFCRVNSSVVPFTRANTADLPANDSLVRASHEPAQAQESVLLRAATTTQEQHEEQLLRATAN